ncbi:hypothetical protein KT99_17880 [Shewanella benthica KT99]|uniref:Uncharacterized protein n=1 Tax=Shewanella benthica KT99 TaxID=314608 RepID=A9DB74_9GAMM|nr:hypothetical protein KT99_17880 [Shewanella benthica KT99]
MAAELIADDNAALTLVIMRVWVQEKLSGV